MRISIIIPALNEAGGISRTLQLLQVARRQGHEIVLTDGGSTDSTVELAAPLVDKVLQGPRGRATQMNHGAAAATGDLLLFIHADTLVQPDALNALLITLGNKAGAEVWGRFNVRINNAAAPYRVIERMMNLRSRLTSVATGDQGIFVSRALFERIGGYASLPLMEDIELSKRLRKVSAPLIVIEPIHTSARRWEKSGMTRTVVHMWCLRLAYVCGVPVERLARWY